MLSYVMSTATLAEQRPYSEAVQPESRPDNFAFQPKMRCKMHELNAPLWTECRQNAKKNAENAQKCTSQKRYQFVAKTVLTPGKEPEPWRASTGEHGLLLKIFVRPCSTPASALAGTLASLRAPRAHGRAVDHELTMPRRCRACNGPRRAPLQPRPK